MKRLLVLFVLLIAVLYSNSIIAQEMGAIRKSIDYSFPEKIQSPVLDPLPAGTYTIGTGGNFATIQDAFNKLKTDGVAGNVTLELIDELYTAPADTFGFLLDGPIPGARPNSRVTIKPAANKNVIVEGNWRYVFTFRNVSYVSLDGVSTEGSTTLTIHSLYNSQYEVNRGVGFMWDSDHNIVQNLTVICDDILRDGIGIFFIAGENTIVAPDSNLIKNNFIKKAGAGIYISAYYTLSNTRPVGNIVRGNKVGSETDSLIAWGIQVEKCKNSIVENNIVQNLTVNNGYAFENMNLGINSYWGDGDIIRNNIVHDINSNANQNSTGIQLSGDVGHVGNNNLIYNNMVFNIHSTSTQSNSRVAGIQLWRQNNPKIYYNSVYLSGTGTSHLGSGALFIWGDCANVEAKNNILVNTRDESPYYATAIYDYSLSNLTSDYNDLYANNYLVRIGNTNYNTLADWQAQGKDLNSITEMPHFVDPYLHINPSALTQINGGAFPIAEVTSDFDGDLRNELNPDIGADEFLVLLDTLYVPQEYSTIQEAINAAVDENLVLVDDGTYLENINIKGKAITIASRFFIDGDESHIENTIIDGSQPADPDSASVVTFNAGEDTTSILCGFTITGGTGTILNIPSIGLRRIGGGILAYNSGAAITNNIIELNSINYSSDSWGGGIGAFTHTARNYIIDNNIIRDNSITTPTIIDYSLGGGIYTQTAGYVRIANNKILENSITAPQGWGGGILPANFGGGSYFILNNIISGNYIYATTGGSGGIDIYNHSPVVKNNLIFLNSAPKGGGACIEDASPIFANNIIAYNTATGSGGGLDIIASVPELMNCIIWGNSATTSSQINGIANVSYSDVEGGYSGTGNIDIDPLFRDAANGDFHLQSTDCGYSFNSPCIDAGNPAYEDWPLNCDWGLGQVRSDMGAYGGTNSIVDVPEEDVQLPSDYVLYQNYPNPFNPSTTFRYSIPQTSKVVIKVYDILGNEVAILMDEEKSVGTYELTWSAESLPSGVYFYQLRAGEFVQTRKMILLK